MRNGPQGLEEVNMTQFREQKGSPKVEWETEGATGPQVVRTCALLPRGDQVVNGW